MEKKKYRVLYTYCRTKLGVTDDLYASLKEFEDRYSGLNAIALVEGEPR